MHLYSRSSSVVSLCVSVTADYVQDNDNRSNGIRLNVGIDEVRCRIQVSATDNDPCPHSGSLKIPAIFGFPVFGLRTSVKGFNGCNSSQAWCICIGHIVTRAKGTVDAPLVVKDARRQKNVFVVANRPDVLK